jgi:hypothetical protein
MKASLIESRLEEHQAAGILQVAKDALSLANSWSTNSCTIWKSPKSTAAARDGENPSDSVTELSLSPSPVSHSASAKCP